MAKKKQEAPAAEAPFEVTFKASVKIVNGNPSFTINEMYYKDDPDNFGELNKDFTFPDKEIKEAMHKVAWTIRNKIRGQF